MVIYRSCTTCGVPKHSAVVRGLFQCCIPAFVSNGWNNSQNTSLSLDRNQPNRDSVQLPLGIELPVHNPALSRVWGASCMCYSSTGLAFVKAVWGHCSMNLDIREPRDIQKGFQIPALLVILVPVYFAAHQKWLIQLWNSQIRDTAGLILNISSTPVTTLYEYVLTDTK